MPAYKVAIKYKTDAEEWIDFVVAVAADTANALAQGQKIANIATAKFRPVAHEAVEIPDGVTFLFTAAFELNENLQKEEDGRIILT